MSSVEGASSLTTGRISRANGRISFLMIGVVASESFLVAFCAGASAFANGSQLRQRRPERVGGGLDLGQFVARLFQRPRQQVQRPAEVGVLLGEGREHRVGGAHQLGELFVLAADGFHQQPEVVDRLGDVLVAALQFVGDFGAQAGGRQEALERRRQRPAVVVEAFPGPGQQRLQVEARFGVQAGQEFVEVDVRGRLGDGQRFAAVQLARARRPGADLDRHVLQRRLGAHQHGRVLVEAGVLGGDPHRHRGHAALHFHARDFTDLGAGDRDGLALAGGDRLGGLEAGLQRVGVFAQHRAPTRGDGGSGGRGCSRRRRPRAGSSSRPR